MLGCSFIYRPQEARSLTVVLTLCESSESGNADGVRGGNAGVDAECCHGIGHLMVFLSQFECVQGNFLELHSLIQTTQADSFASLGGPHLRDAVGA